MERRRDGRGCREAASTMMESMSTDWTDEKHSLYLNSMEESFVNQMYNHEFCSNSLFGLTTKITKSTDSPGSQMQNNCSGQFKFLRGGNWGEVKFESSGTQRDVQREPLVLCRSPWIRHFMSTSRNKKFHSFSSEHLGDYSTDRADILEGTDRHVETEGRKVTSIGQPHTCFTHFCHLNSISCNTEVSDQNFVDDSIEAKRSRRAHKRKRSETAGSSAIEPVDLSGKPQ